jgi:predicted dehydrogenase
MPLTLYYERSASGAGCACFTFPGGQVANLVLAWKPSTNGGMERTMVVADNGSHLVADNNIRLSYHRGRAGIGEYGTTPSYFTGHPESQSKGKVKGQSESHPEGGTLYWEPEFSLGQLYNKGLFLLGYYNEVNEFARSILEKRKPAKGTLDDALKITRIFECFAEGPQKLIQI